jgi:signal transduction histidine kinase
MLHLRDVDTAEEATDEPLSPGTVRSLRSMSPPDMPSLPGQAAHEDAAQALASHESALDILGHELRNPLSAIAALARGLVLRSDLPADTKERLVQIDRAAQRSLLMISRVLEFSEIRSRGTLPVHPTPIDLAALAATVVEEMRLAYPGRTIDLEVSGRAEFALDPLRIGQVLSNLVGNALVHGTPGAPVRVVLDVCDREACFVVVNHGPIIPAERMDSLFQPFTRGLADDGVAAQGLGLGLHIADVVVAAHGGTITVSSDAEAGTAFTVRLPRRAR